MLHCDTEKVIFIILNLSSCNDLKDKTKILCASGRNTWALDLDYVAGNAFMLCKIYFEVL